MSVGNRGVGGAIDTNGQLMVGPALESAQHCHGIDIAGYRQLMEPTEIN